MKTDAAYITCIIHSICLFLSFFNVISAGVIMCLLTTDDDENNNKTCYLGHYCNNFVNEFNLTEEKSTYKQQYPGKR